MRLETMTQKQILAFIKNYIEENSKFLSRENLYDCHSILTVLQNETLTYSYILSHAKLIQNIIDLAVKIYTFYYPMDKCEVY